MFGVIFEVEIATDKKSEYLQIAAKLKETLKSSDAISNQTQTSAERIIAKNGTNGQFNHDDTIHIDKDGNFSARS